MAAGDDSEIPGKSKHVQGSQSKEYRDSRDAMNVVFSAVIIQNPLFYLCIDLLLHKRLKNDQLRDLITGRGGGPNTSVMIIRYGFNKN